MTMLLDEPPAESLLGLSARGVEGPVGYDESDDHPMARPEIQGVGRRMDDVLRKHSRGIMLAGGGAVVALASTLLIVGVATRNTAPPIDPLPPTSQAPAPAVADTVEIRIQGLTSDTKVTIDDHPATLPVRVARGPTLHRIVLQSPQTPDRSIEVDGTTDRTIELVKD
jgi:hypothetical protein